MRLARKTFGSRFSRLTAAFGVMAVVSLLATTPVRAATSPEPVAGDACIEAQYGVSRSQPGGRVLICLRTTRKWALFTPAQPLPKADTGAVTLSKSIYIYGTRVDVASVDIVNRVITVKARATNENLADKTFDDVLLRTPVFLEGADSVRAELRVIDYPSTPAGSASALTWTADAPDGLVLSTARLVFGSTNQNQSFIPLGTGKPTTFVPKKGFAVGTKWAGKGATFEILDSKVRAAYRSDEKGKYELHIRVRVTGLVGSPGGTNVFIEQFSVKPEKGNAIVGNYDGGGDISPLNIIVNKGKGDDGWLQFALENPSGKYVLQFRDPSNPANAANQELTIP